VIQSLWVSLSPMMESSRRSKATKVENHGK